MPCRLALLQSKLPAARWKTRADLVMLMEAARRKIEVIPLSEISLDLLAAEVGISKFHFVKLFRETYGSTPIRYAARAKLLAAQPRLVREESITEIAFDAGFSSLSAFGRAFKVAFGVSPSEFRNLGGVLPGPAELA